MGPESCPGWPRIVGSPPQGARSDFLLEFATFQPFSASVKTGGPGPHRSQFREPQSDVALGGHLGSFWGVILGRLAPLEGVFCGPLACIFTWFPIVFQRPAHSKVLEQLSSSEDLLCSEVTTKALQVLIDCRPQFVCYDLHIYAT